MDGDSRFKFFLWVFCLLICFPTGCFGVRAMGFCIFKMELLSGPSFIIFEIRFFSIIQEQII